MHPPAEIGASPALRLLDDDSSDRLHILCSGDVRGTCEFSAFGLFSVRLGQHALLFPSCATASWRSRSAIPNAPLRFAGP
jgi:hypothetical protein